jgi:tRNA G18 (ribose-2'-O)-methylase SpoU
MGDGDAITSPTNARYKLLKDLWTSKGIAKHGACLVGGEKLVAEALADRTRDVVAVVASGTTASGEGGEGAGLERDVEDAAAARQTPVWRLAPALFREIDESGTRRPLAVVKVAAPEAVTALPAGPCLVLPLQSPENLGAAVRSALAFGIDEIVLTTESANPYLPRAVRGSAGAVLRARFRRTQKLAALRPDAERALVLDGGGQPLAKALATPRAAPIWIVGVEGGGVPPELGGLERVSIPISSAVEPLNAAVALSIALHQWRLSRG